MRSWREYERELVEFFNSEGIDVVSDGDKHVEIPPHHTWENKTYVSLTKLARRLAEEGSKP
jgi:hypothetical protein